ncbi:MAG: DUF748 domain-containing protein [Nitrospinae bacterium]|nr:DUF748 domain-containing protein [Nitrospinota bacterium]
MYRILKWLIWIASICFVFIIVAAVAVQIFLSSDEIKRFAEREGQNILGRRVSIERLEVGLFKIEASGIVVGGQKEKSGAKNKNPFVRFDDVEILLNPSTLIYKRISILQLTIKSAFARVYRDAKGRFDYQDIIDNLNRRAGYEASARAGNTFSFVKSAEAAASFPKGSESGLSFTIHELDLYDVKTELRFDASDTAPAFDGSCSFAHIEVDKITPGEPVDIFLDGKCQAPGGKQLIQLKGDALFDMKGPSYRGSFAMPLVDSSLLPVVAPTIPGYRFRGGIFAGNLKFDYISGKPITWDIDLNGQDVHAEFQMNRQGEWQRLALPGLKLKTKGRFDLSDGSARIETFFVETNFLNAKITQPSIWNVSARDEVHVEVNIRDIGEMGNWVTRVTNIPLSGLKERATAQILVSGKRERKISDDVVRVEMKSRFDPIDLASFGGFIPPVDQVSKIQGNVGGNAHVVFDLGERVEWDVALETRDVSASVRVDKRKPWEILELGSGIFHSKGNFDIRNSSAHIYALEIKLPFAKAKLERPAKWNADGDDEAAFSVDVSDFISANDILERLELVSLGDVPRDAKLRLKASVSRNRKVSSPIKVDAKTHFTSLPIASLADLIPVTAYVQKVAGRVSGELQVASAPDGALRWKAEIAGKKLGARSRIIPGDKWRKVSLESLKIQSSGSYLASEGSSEIQTLDLKLPFARAYLNRVAIWNQRSKDEFSLTLDVTDLSAAQVWLGELMEYSIKPGPKSEKLKISLSGTRNRKDGPGFSYKGSVLFDPVQISPWVKFVSLPPIFRNPAGEVGGKIEFSYVPQEKISWNLGLTSEDLRGEFLALMSHDWRLLRTGKLRIETAGIYDLRNQSGRIHSLNLNMPFGYVQTSRPADWSTKGMHSGRFDWALSSLEGAARFAGSYWGAPISEFSIAGSANGSMEISRSRKKAQPTTTKWTFSANLSSLAHAAYPNLKVTGSISGKVDGSRMMIRIPKLRTSGFGKPNAEPDIFLKNLNTSLDRSSISRGEIRSSSVRIEKLNFRYVRHVKGTTNFGSLFKMRKALDERSRQERSREKTGSSDTKTASKIIQKTGQKEGGHLFPAIKIAKFEVARMGFYFQDSIAEDKPPVVLRVPDAKLSIKNLDTLMASSLRETRLEFRTLGETPSILVKANLNPASAPPDADGIFNFSSFDLRKISPYVRDSKGESASALLMRGTEITRGKLDFKSTYSLRKNRLNLEGNAKITGLRLKPDEKFPLVDLVVKLLRESVFRLFERPDDKISLNVRVSGRLDDPEFHFLDAIVEPMFVGLFEKAQNLGDNLKDIVTGILGTAIEGVQKIVPIPKDSRTVPEKDSGKGVKEKESQLERLGKKLENTLQKGLRGLFGVK